MGKRKSSSKPQGPKKKEVLATTFSCLFCNHENSVSVKMDKKAGIGELSCKICNQSFQSQINYLSAAVDVYSDWVDACDNVAKDTAERETDIGEYPRVGALDTRRTEDANAETNAELGIIDDEEDEADYDEY